MRLHIKNLSDQWSSKPKQMWQQQSSSRLQMISAIYHVLLLTLLTQIARAAAARSLAIDKRSASAPATDEHPLSLHVNKTCFTYSCNDTLNQHYIHEIERNIDRNVSACDDFHRYACGNWQPPNAHSSSASMLQVAEEQLTSRYLELFERALSSRRYDDPSTTTAAVNRAIHRQRIRRARTHNRRAVTKTHKNIVRNREKLRDIENMRKMQTEDYNLVFSKLLEYYHVCMQSEQLTLHGYYDQLHSEGLLHLRRRHWQDMLANFARFGYGEHFVYFRVRQQNATQHDIYVLPHDTLKRVNLTEKIYDILRTHTHLSRADLAEEFGVLENDVETIVNATCTSHEYKLRNATASPTNITDELATPINIEEDCDLSEILTVAELTARCSEIDWQRFIGVPLGRHLHAHDRIRVESLETVCKLARYINQAQHAEINFLYTLARFLSHLQQQNYNPVRLGGNNATCIRHMRKMFPGAMTYVYDQAYYAPVRTESDRIIHSIFAQLKTEFAHTLSLNRMHFDADIVAYLQQKLQSLRINIGNLPPKVNSSFYVDLIWQLNVSKDNFYSNHLHALAHAFGHLRRLASSASKNHSRSAWYTFNYHYPTFVDSLDWTPYYFCLSNIIIVPHVYLQTPFYDREFWPALLYGDLANTLGHELIHSFDTNFLEYDSNGNMNELMLQRISSNQNFVRNIKCLNKNTKFVAERIADVSGTRLALNTFLRDLSFRQRNGRLFFLQFAQFFCSRAEEATHQLLDPWHDSDILRLNYTLAQMPEFTEAFSCPANSPMAAVERCEMW